MRKRALFLLPIVFSLAAISGLGFIFKAAVTISCLLIIFQSYQKVLLKPSDTWYIVLAFIFSIIGDWFLSNKGESFLMFAVGIGFYFLAHAGYLIFALNNGRLNKGFTMTILIIYLIFFALVLWPAIQEPILLGAVLIYLLISCFSLGASLDFNGSSAVRWSYFTGIGLILLSDTIISFKEFTTFQRLNFLILPTYYVAHMIITYALILKREYQLR